VYISIDPLVQTSAWRGPRQFHRLIGQDHIFGKAQVQTLDRIRVMCNYPWMGGLFWSMIVPSCLQKNADEPRLACRILRDDRGCSSEVRFDRGQAFIVNSAARARRAAENNREDRARERSECASWN